MSTASGLSFNSERSTINGEPIVSVKEDLELPGHESRRTECTVCKEIIVSKRQLFKHLEQVHFYVDETSKPVKVACLVGWISQERLDIEHFIKDQRLEVDVNSKLSSSSSPSFVDPGGNALTPDEVNGNGTTKTMVETALFDAIRLCFDENTSTRSRVPLSISSASASDCTIEESSSSILHMDTPTTSRGIVDAGGNGSGGQKKYTQSHAWSSTSLRPKSLTRGSQGDMSTLAVGVERTCHALSDTFCFPVSRPPSDEQSWLDSVNAKLPEHIRVLSCRVLPGKGSDMNAQVSCTQRRFEYLVPLDAFLPDNDIDYDSLANHFIEGKVFKTLGMKAEWDSKPKSGGRLDKDFPVDTPHGERRVRFFRILKQVMKTFGGRYQMFYNFCSGGVCPDDTYAMRTIDRMYHKDMIISEDGMLWALFSITGDNFLRGQIRRMFGLAFAIARGWLPEQYLELVLRFSTVYRDQLAKRAREKAKIEAVAKAKARKAEEATQMERKRAERAERNNHAKLTEAGDSVQEVEIRLGDLGTTAQVLEVKEDEDKCKKRTKSKEAKGNAKKVSESTGEEVYVQDFRNAKSHVCNLQLTCEALFEIPSAPPLGLYLAECRYANYEAKYNKIGFVVDPRRVKDEFKTETDHRLVERMDAWEKHIQRHIMRDPQMLAESEKWGATTRAQCVRLWAYAQKMMVLLTRTEDDLRSTCLSLYPSLSTTPKGGNSMSSSSVRAPEAYRKVLQLLQEADYSGFWPASSLARQRVMYDVDVKVDHGGTGGTFSVGAFPKGPNMQEPKGNSLFPELVQACFELEHVLLPNRPPSSTIAINRNAQFKPHRDSGIGSGQSQSAIVALGDFVGGELGVEHEVFDIRYKPLEFDGWSQRHFTLPFQGERYSLVWFTPQGCEQDTMNFNNDDDGEVEGTTQEECVEDYENEHKKPRI